MILCFLLAEIERYARLTEKKMTFYHCAVLPFETGNGKM